MTRSGHLTGQHSNGCFFFFLNSFRVSPLLLLQLDSPRWVQGPLDLQEEALEDLLDLLVVVPLSTCSPGRQVSSAECGFTAASTNFSQDKKPNIKPHSNTFLSLSGTKSRYVDVLNPSRTAKPGGLAPAPADIFAPLAPMTIPANRFVPSSGVCLKSIHIIKEQTKINRLPTGR